jgi:hypothetical protein
MMQPQPVTFGSEPIAISTRPMTDMGFPLLIEPENDAASVAELQSWIDRNRLALKKSLLHYGGIVFRGFRKVKGLEEFEQIMDTICPELLPYIGGTTTRSTLSGKIATASGTRFKGTIPVHQEMAYQETFPSHVMFYCLQPARSGGQTLVASVRAFQAALPLDIWKTFVTRGVKTCRTLSPKEAPWGVWNGRSWNDALLTDSREDAERIMNGLGWKYEWTRVGGLAIEQPPLPATRIHPETGEEIWFNQCHVNHPFMIRTVLRADGRYFSWLATVVLQMLTKGARYPTQTHFADGSRIPMRYPRVVQKCLDSVTVAIDWRQSDFLIIDNYLMFHGRARYEGPRTIGAALLTSAFNQEVASSDVPAECVRTTSMQASPGGG